MTHSHPRAANLSCGCGLRLLIIVYRLPFSDRPSCSIHHQAASQARALAHALHDIRRPLPPRARRRRHDTVHLRPLWRLQVSVSRPRPLCLPPAPIPASCSYSRKSGPPCRSDRVPRHMAIISRPWRDSDWTASDDRVRGGQSQVCTAIDCAPRLPPPRHPPPAAPSALADTGL